MYRFLLLAAALLLSVGFSSTATAQTVVAPPEERASPLQMTRVMLGDDAGSAYVKVMYSSPRKRDRVIFGELVPYDQVWRTGANEATELTTTAPLEIGDETIGAGTYSVFTIPGEDEWTIIFNEGLNQWGAFGYDEGLDALRITVPAETMDQMYEAFTIGFEGGAAEEDAEDTGETNLVMMWDQTKVSIPIEMED